jgi:pimeloyl-ACP methyl ester carboxylesterase
MHKVSAKRASGLAGWSDMLGGAEAWLSDQGMDQRFVRTTCPASGLSFLAGGEGAPVVLVHGLGWDGGRLWAAQMGTLADAGYRVIVPDLRGTGASPPLRESVSTRDLARDLALLVQTQGAEAPALVGFSMGAMVVAGLAATCAPRGVVLACGGLVATAEGAIATEAMLARAAGLGPVAFAQEQAEAIFGPSFAAAQPDAVADFIGWRAAMDQESLHHAFRAPYGQDLRAVVRGLACPVHVIAADQDRFLRLAEVAALSGEIGAASMTVIEDSGHMAPVEQPAAFNAALMQALGGM